MKQRISVDQDQCIADILSVWLYRYNNDYNDNLTSDQITQWNFHELVKPSCSKKIYKYLDDPSLFANLPVIEGSQDAIRKLSESYEIFFVTAPFNPNNILPKYNWLKKHFGFIPEENYVFTRNKSIINSSWLIDDKPENFIEFQGVGLLYSAPHNSKCNKYRRVGNWQDVLNFFNINI
ncbi:5'-3'-deoxyribonucleotidase [Paenibacillaceae bacterium]|nr:5'-3'-deoxyribonucleotidase [Paenibacillaceae bacterium]